MILRTSCITDCTMVSEMKHACASSVGAIACRHVARFGEEEMAIFKTGNGESGNRGIRESGNPGIGGSGNRGIQESGNPGIGESRNRGIRECANL